MPSFRKRRLNGHDGTHSSCHDRTDVAHQREFPYSITSSGIASAPGGIDSPSVWAVLRLMISSNFWCARIIGRSAGFSPYATAPSGRVQGPQNSYGRFPLLPSESAIGADLTPQIAEHRDNTRGTRAFP